MKRSKNGLVRCEQIRVLDRSREAQAYRRALREDWTGVGSMQVPTDQVGTSPGVRR